MLPFAHPLRIGALSVPSRVMAAPLCGVSNSPHRRLVRRFCAGLVVTEMVKAYPLLRDDPKTRRLAHFEPEEHPVACQIAGSEPELMALAAQKLEALGFDLIDINAGCPVGKVTKLYEGCAMMRDPPAVARMIAAMVRAVRVPVSIKFRAGWDAGSRNFLDFGKSCADAGAAMLTLHPRTREQGLGGKADWSLIAALKQGVDVPVIGNGDLGSGEDARRMVLETGCDGVMLGRRGSCNPWLFAEVEAALSGRPAPEPPSLAERRTALLGHYDMLVGHFGGHIAHLLMRRYLCHYVKGLPGAVDARRRAAKLSSPAEFLAIVSQYLSEAPETPIAAGERREEAPDSRPLILDRA